MTNKSVLTPTQQSQYMAHTLTGRYTHWQSLSPETWKQTLSMTRLEYSDFLHLGRLTRAAKPMLGRMKSRILLRLDSTILSMKGITENQWLKSSGCD